MNEGLTIEMIKWSELSCMGLDKDNFDIWYKEATKNDKKLYRKVKKFGSLFEDMLLNGEFYDFVTETTFSGNLPQYEDTFGAFQEKHFSYKSFRYYTEGFEDWRAGKFSTTDRTLFVHADELNNDDVILHEMIHLHEWYMDMFSSYYRDMYIFYLYFKLRGLIPYLDNIIRKYTEIVSNTEEMDNSMNHDVLFLLKSLDLDLSKGYQLGTVMSYGAKDIIEEIRNGDFD